MTELFSQLGINWKLLVAQTVNFLLLLVILRFTVYKPLLSMLKERREKIEQGLKDAEAAGKKLDEAESEKRAKVKEGEEKSLAIIAETEKKSKVLEAELTKAAEAKSADLLERAKAQAEANTEEERRRFYEEAVSLVKSAMEKTTEAAPEAIDEKLIGQVVAKLK